MTTTSPITPDLRIEPSTNTVSTLSKTEDLDRIVNWIQQELRVLRMEHSAILKRIGVIKKTVTGLADVFGPSVLTTEMQSLLSVRTISRDHSRPGPTALCRQLLKESSTPLTVREIVARIQEKHPDALAHHRDPAVSLRIVLRRLVTYCEAEEVLSNRGLRAWKWTPGREQNPHSNKPHTDNMSFESLPEGSSIRRHETML
jgi:hypothetical protein